MNRRIHAALLVLLISAAAAHAQQSEIIFRSAVAEAIATDGVIDPSDGTSDPMVARAVYVKLRPDVVLPSPAGTLLDAPSTAAAIISAAGLNVSSATRLAHSNVPLEKSLEATIAALPDEQQGRIAESEAEIARIIEIHYTDDIDPVTVAARLEKLPGFEYAEPVWLPHVEGSALVPNDPMINEQPHLEAVRAFDAWDLWPGDTNMVIGIVDSGIDMFHVDLWNNIKENPGESGPDGNGGFKQSNGIDDDLNGIIDDWRGANLTADLDTTTPGDTKGHHHGTAVAGLAAASTNNGIGVAGAGYLCRFFPIKAATKSSGTILEGYSGILYAARRGCQVINCSWGGFTVSEVGRDIVNHVRRSYNAAVVAAAGNGLLYQRRYPAGFDHVLGVAGVDFQDSVWTTWGEHVDVSAPLGKTTIDNNSYSHPGPPTTSFTAPVAAGVLALVRSKYPSLDPAQAVAHIRNTARRMAPGVISAEKYRLTGTGVLDAYRAVSEDPFDQPAVLIDTMWLADQNGVPRNAFSVGDKGTIRFRLRNILGDATNLRINVAHYTDDSTAVRIDSVVLSLASLASGETGIPEGGVPFEITGIDSQQVRLRFDFLADGGYDDYRHTEALFYEPYHTFNTGRIELTITDKGDIGFTDFPENTVGKGVKFDGRQLLYEAGFILAADSQRVISNVRGADGGIRSRDFFVTEAPSESNGYTVSFTDAGVEERRKIGLDMSLRVVTLPENHNPSGIGLVLRTRNVRSVALEKLHIAMFADWDVGDSPSTNRVRLETDVPNRYEHYGLFSGSSGIQMAFGAMELDGEYIDENSDVSPIPITNLVFHSINNGAEPINIYDGYTDAEKWLSVSTMRQTAGPADVSLVMGRTVENLAPGEETATLFTIGAGSTDAEALAAIVQFVRIETHVEAEAGGTTALLGTPRPNPATTSIRVPIGKLERGATLALYDVLGKQVLDITPVLPATGSEATLEINVSHLTPGVYHLRATSGGRTATQQIIVR